MFLKIHFYCLLYLCLAYFTRSNVHHETLIKLNLVQIYTSLTSINSKVHQLRTLKGEYCTVVKIERKASTVSC